ncbi:MAG: methyltransferase domain-containing protein [Deltaproteobacteria bacterium]|nr:methyltransferase domain-containing protein [Deltaproteobacteria bacterium]
MSSLWFELSFLATEESKDLISEKLFEFGVEGVNENVNQPNLLHVYVSLNLRESVVSQLKEQWVEWQKKDPQLPNLKINIDRVPNENWAESYKKYYIAQSLTDLFFLKPEWDKQTAIPPGMIPIIMDPGQAFGTGLHPSTRLCLKTIQSQVLDSINSAKLKCLDVGTGSGILALAAFHLGVKSVVGIDNDPVAIEVAKQNMQLNKVVDIDLSIKEISKLEPYFDFVISNILLETHRELSPDYARLVPKGGLLLLSGLLGYQRKELMEFILPLGFVVLESKNFQEWASFLFLRRDPQ